MKKVLSLGLLLTLTGLLFAETAQLLPAHVWRFRIVPYFGIAPGGWDKDGTFSSYGSGEGTAKQFGLGTALEYGVFDFLTVALQWTPAYAIWSDVDKDIPGGKKLVAAGVNDVTGHNANGFGDLFIGLASQLVGNKPASPFKSDMFRATLAAGIKAPLPGPDYVDSIETIFKDQKAARINTPDKHTLGIGIRGYFDYIALDWLTLNLYSEFLFYPLKSTARKSDFQTVAAAYGAGYGGVMGSGGAAVTAHTAGKTLAETAGDLDVDVGYDLTFEFEPAVNFSPGDGIRFEAGLPVNFQYLAANKTDIDNAPAQLKTALTGAQYSPSDDPTLVLSLKPNVSFLFGKDKLLPFPSQIKLTYDVPVWGKNNRFTNLISLQFIGFFQFW